MRELIAIKANLSANAFWLTALRLHALFVKAGFNPDQPRVKPGYREGGQWTSDGSGTPSVPKPNLEFDEEGNPQLPTTRPDTPQVRNRLSKQLAKAARKLPPFRIIEIFKEYGWLLDNAFAILTYQDPPRTLEELQQRAVFARGVRQTPLGYHIHHIVEQEAARQAGFPEQLIKGWENEALVPKYAHEDITGWYMRRNKDFGGLSPREYLRGKSWEERWRVGLDALTEAGVLVE